jgi:branched-chain amino acid transport system ATP-binding protein
MMLTVDSLSAGYGQVPVLNRIGFGVGDGEFVGILGHNGMGKTTLMKTLVGRLRATGGSIRFKDTDITRLPQHRRARLGLGFVPQGREIFPDLSVYENLRMGALGRSEPEGEVIAEVLQEFPRLERLLERRGGALSGGEQQLLALARCLCGAPDLVLLDEPTEGIQPSIIDEIVDSLHRLKAKRNLTVLLVEQNLDFIAALSERVLIINKGEITREIAPEHLADAALVGEFVGFAAEGEGPGAAAHT